MVFRATTHVCCCLTCWAPAIALVQVVEHAHEHLQAKLTGHGHAHAHGQVPHHEHEADGSPIRADESGGVLRVAPPTMARVLTQLTQPALFAAWVGQVRAPADRLTVDGRCKHLPYEPWIPSAGDALPLLI